MVDVKEVLEESSKKFGKPLNSYKMTYDSPQSQLEPIYFWLLDFVQGMGFSVEKITDNFQSTPGSGHFSEMGGKLAKMQEEGMKIYGLLNQTIKNVMNLLYDLKEFEIRLGHYESANSKDPAEKEAGILSLKQIWLDNVDIKRGNTSVKAMTFSQTPFATLIDAFMAVKDESLKDPKGNEIDLNDRVKRLLKQKILEFKKWKELSYTELMKRYKIEKSYLKSQVETVKLQASWIRPYLKAAEELRQKGFDKNPSLVNAFSTTMFELTLLGKRKVKFDEAVEEGKLPKGFNNYKLKRDYNACVLINFTFRGNINRVTQKGDYSFASGGRVDMTFDSYALNDDELELFAKNLDKKDIEESFKFIDNTAEESLEQLKEDLDHFLNDEYKPTPKEKEKKQDDINPFSALFGLFKNSDGKDKKNKKEITEIKNIKKDNYVEEYVRASAATGAKESLHTIYDIYKKAHGMASAPDEGFDVDTENPEKVTFSRIFKR